MVRALKRVFLFFLSFFFQRSNQVSSARRSPSSPSSFFLEAHPSISLSYCFSFFVVIFGAVSRSPVADKDAPDSEETTSFLAQIAVISPARSKKKEALVSKESSIKYAFRAEKKAPLLFLPCPPPSLPS